MEDNVILSLDMAMIINNAYKNDIDKILEADTIVTKHALYEAGGKRQLLDGPYKSLLFVQTEKTLSKMNSNVKVSDILFIMEFKNCVRKHYDILAKYYNGIKITLDDRKVTIIDFVKSNSMSKDSRMYYIDKNYYHEVNKAVNFGILDKSVNVNIDVKIDIAKWFAYTGLTVTDCIVLDNIRLSADEVCIVDDKIRTVRQDAITAISLPLLLDNVKKILEYKKNPEHKEVRMIRDNYFCYLNSSDFSRLPEEWQDIINTVCDNIKKPNYFENISALKEKYKDIESGKEVAWATLNVRNFPVEVNYYDGEGLISLELEKQINDGLKGKKVNYTNEDDDAELEEKVEVNDTEAKYHSFQIRLPFVKGVVHSCDLQGFFKENNIKTIIGKTFSRDPNAPKTKVYDASKVKMILTTSQFKLSKFITLLELKENETPIDAYFRLLNQYDYTLGISNVDDFAAKEYVKLCYQFFSTMPLDGYDSKELFETTQNYLDVVANDETTLDSIRLSAKTDIVSKRVMEVYEKCPEFVYNTNFFKNKTKKLYEDEKSNILVSKMTVKGTRKYLSSDLLGLLYHAADLKIPQSEEFPVYNFYMPNTETIKSNFPYAILRNPHYSRNEIKMLRPWDDVSPIRNKYFGHLTGVIMVNPQSLTADRLGGADYDGDTVVVTWQPGLIYVLSKNLLDQNREIYPVIKIPSLSADKDKFNHFQRVKCLRNTFDSRVGAISDDCFAFTFDAYKENRCDEVAEFTILSGLEIDSVKNGRKPKLKKVKDKDGKAQLFLAIKKAYKNTSTYGDDFDKMLKSNIEQAKKIDGIIFNNIKSIDNYKMPKVKHFKHKLPKNDNLELNHAIEIAAVTYAFHSFEKRMRKLRKRRAKYLKSNDNAYQEISEIKREIENILAFKGEEISLGILTEYCKTPNRYQTLRKYLDSKLYFIKDDALKLRTLEEIGLGSLPDNIKDILVDYKKDGFKLLYLVLYYLNEISFKNIDFDTRSEEEKQGNIFKPVGGIRGLTNTYGVDFMNKVGIRVLEMFDLFNSIVSEVLPQELDIVDNISHYLDEIEKRVYGYMRKITENYTFKDLTKVVDVYSTEIIFKIFYRQLKQYLEAGGDTNGIEN